MKKPAGKILLHFWAQEIIMAHLPFRCSKNQHSEATECLFPSPVSITFFHKVPLCILLSPTCTSLTLESAQPMLHEHSKLSAQSHHDDPGKYHPPSLNMQVLAFFAIHPLQIWNERKGRCLQSIVPTGSTGFLIFLFPVMHGFKIL